MLERWNQLSGQLAVLSSVALATYIYLKILNRKFKHLGENIEWLQLHKMKLSLMMGMPLLVIYGPAIEELFFRAPLIVLFGQASGYAWFGIIASSVVFATIHYFNPASFFLSDEIIEVAKKGEKKFSEASREIEEKEKRKLHLVRLWQVGFAFIMGLVLSYCGIKYQSLYFTFGLHALWNLFGSAVIMLLMLLICLPVELIVQAFRKRRRRNQFRKAMMERW